MRLALVSGSEDFVSAPAAKCSPSAGKDVERVLRRGKIGKRKCGEGGAVKCRRQAVAIGLPETRKKGKKVPEKGSAKRKGGGE
jgi:hypothetical protein